MSEVKLLPLPEWDGDFMTESEFREKAQSYARANLAERDAEVEALQYRLETAEAYGLQCDADIRSLLSRAERLAEALREAFKAMQRSYHSDVRILFHELGAVMDVSTELGIRLCAPPEALRGEQEQATLNPTAAQENDDA